MHQELNHLLAPIRSSLSKQEKKMLDTAEKLQRARKPDVPAIWGLPRREPLWDFVELVLKMKLGVPSICAALLYPRLQEGSLELSEVKTTFPKSVFELCESLLKLPDFALPETINEPRLWKEDQNLLNQQAGSFRKMLFAIARDLRVVLIRLCDRLHHLKRMSFVPVEIQAVLAHECREIYAPLANRLGISWLKNELEDLTLRYLYPRSFYSIAEKIAAKQKEREEYISKVKKVLEELFQKQNINCQVMGRSKHLNSIYLKSTKRGVPFEEQYDILAFRAICDTVEQCYQILGIIHGTWKPIPKRFKDYIALPKPNMYQSLHTTVLGPMNKRMEIQIRTHEMHRMAEEGVAAHWLYKENNPQGKAVEKSRWLRSLLSLQDEKSDDHEFMATLQDQLLEGEVFVFTPKGEVREFPKGATPLDFAYAIHTKVGESCVGAKANNKIVPLRYEMQNGDFVEILTSPSAKPNRDWLKMAKTNRARTKIRSFLRAEQRQEALVLGRELLEKSLPTSNRSITKLIKSGALPKVSKDLHHASIDEMFIQIGYGKQDPTAVVDALFPPEVEEPTDEIQVKENIQAHKPTGGILVGGLSGIQFTTARCCNPIPGDPIIGFISRGRGVIIHTKDCAKLEAEDPNRYIDVVWEVGQTNRHTVTLRVECKGAKQPGILSRISKVFEDLNINITSAKCDTRDDEAINHFTCQVADVKQLKRLIRQLEDVRNVTSVTRLRQ